MENKEFESYVQKRISTICTSLAFYREQLSIIDETSKLRELTLDELNRETEIRKIILGLEKELEEIRKNQKEVSKEENEEIEETNSKTNNGNGTRVFVGVCALVLAASLFYNAASRNKKDTLSTDATITPVPASMITPTTLPEVTASPVITATPEVVGTFTDPTDQSQVEARAEEIYEEDFASMLKGMDSKANKYAAVTEIDNVINISTGNLNGEKFSPTLVDKYVQRRTDIMGNYGSSPQLDKMYPMHYASLAVDGSEEQEFGAEYDKLYNAIVDSRNANNDEATVENIQALAVAMYDDWTMRGAYGGINPYNLDPKVRLYALGASVERWGSHVKEWILSHKATICVEVCRNRETGEMMKVNVEAIYDAIVTGKKNEVTLYVYGEEVYQLISEEFYNDLCKELEYQNSLTLKK